MVSAATNTLGSTLQLTVKTLGTDCATFDGTTVVGPTALDGALIGNAAPGAQAGDRVLTAATNEVLCFQVSLPWATGNAPPEHHLGRDLHVRRRADRQQPVSR